FVLFIESRPELGYAPLKAQSYMYSYSLESLRDIADNIRDDVEEVGSGYYLNETLSKLFELIYNGYPDSEEDILKYSSEESLHDMFVIVPLKAHIFDPEYTKMITNAKLRNCVMLRIIDLMSLTRNDGQRNSRRGRISYANLGINQLGSVYEALLSYRGFIAEHTLYEVKRASDSFNELDVGYFVREEELDQYTEDERVRYERGENRGKLRSYNKGTFIYRLAGREREKSASYYTKEVLTRCLVKYALKELLEGKSADEILSLTVCEPAMGSAAFLNEAINQLAEAYLDKKQKELGEVISYEDRFTELQKVKMYIADRNVYGIDLNPVAVELAEVSLWLNTIFEGGYVPWFGTQLVCGNSLIGARRQCYHVNHLTATATGVSWYENAPERVPLGTKRKPQTQVYHFLLGDPGMSNYTDRVIKSLEPDKVKNIKKWNKEFNSPYNNDDLVTLLRLSSVIDDLWEAQINLRKEVHEKTKDSLSVYGLEDHCTDSHTTIRQKDKILSEQYKSEEMTNAGPYARLKFAMDYWCALWFWPIDKEELLPSRSEFLFDMSLILEGTFASVNIGNDIKGGQISFLPTEKEQIAMDIVGTYGNNSIVDIPQLRKKYPRLNLAYEIAEKNHFMHWELEFADLFAERGGFDLIVGNPPWIKIEWNEQSVLSDSHPMFTVKNLTATQTTQNREAALKHYNTRSVYMNEYQLISGEQAFLNAIQNYNDLRGQQTNLFKCFLPQSWMFNSDAGVSAFIHPDGVYDDPNGDELRKILYPRLRRHYQFVNEKLLFEEVGHPTVFSLNIYGAPRSLKKDKFHSVSNLFDPIAIDECYEKAIGEAEGIKNARGEWSIKGHPDRVLYYGEQELLILAALSGGDVVPTAAKLLALQTKQLLETVRCFAESSYTLRDIDIYMSEMWHETYAQNDRTILRNTIFPSMSNEMICSGPHIAVGNPLFKTPRSICEQKGDYDCIDLSSINSDYIARTNYTIAISAAEYSNRNPEVYGKKYYCHPKLVARKMLNLKQERTLNVAILPEKYGHINGLVGVVFSNMRDFYICAASWSSIPFDYYVKVMGKSNFNFAAASGFPVLKTKYDGELILRGLLLNALTSNFQTIYRKGLQFSTKELCWSKDDTRLKNHLISSEWSYNVPLRTDYERRQALVEIDVLTAMGIGMTLSQLKDIYRLQFAIAQQYEIDTWYDSNGRIVFTNNRSLTNVGFDRSTWENSIKGAPAGKKFYRTITDDTMPGGPIERTIEYVAPFDRCDREQDYETAWAFFEEKYGKQGS
ncbi:MAG: class I SAM-dependent DNA methyltransferase, partial [Fastidiosipila sp.]|nr:class I SAM-dependent DNA methyltransferase [Fastidiosipila sp.]